MQQNIRQRRIRQIIKQNYIQSQQRLNIYYQIDYWCEVLSMRDFTMLQNLSLCVCDITDHSITGLTRLYWPELTNLVLYKNKITGEGIKKIFKISVPGKPFAPEFLKLTWLQLDVNMIGNYGIKILIKADLPVLQHLLLCNCRIRSEGIKHLIKGKWPNLSRLCLNNSQIESGRNRLHLDCCQMLYQNHWKQIQELRFQSSRGICWMNIVLMQTSAVIIKYQSDIKIRNYELRNSVKQILDNRKILKI